MKDILMTSGFNFEGYTISEYLGFFSGECAIGLGGMRGLGDHVCFSDSGVESKVYSRESKKAKNNVMQQLIQQVVEAGGDAIIGLNVDYFPFSRDIMGVVASGTAVKLCPAFSQSRINQAYSLLVLNEDLPFKPMYIHVKTYSSGECVCSLELNYQNAPRVSAVLADIAITDEFKREISLTDIVFTDFVRTSDKNLVSEPVLCTIPFDALKLLSNIKFTVKKYITGQDMSTTSKNPESVCNSQYKSSENDNYDEDRANDLSEFLHIAEQLGNAKAIFDSVVEYSAAHTGVIDIALIERLRKLKDVERFYGNNKDDAIKTLKAFFK